MSNSRRCHYWITTDIQLIERLDPDVLPEDSYVNSQRIFNLRQLATALNVSVNTARNRLNRGQIPATRLTPERCEELGIVQSRGRPPREQYEVNDRVEGIRQLSFRYHIPVPKLREWANEGSLQENLCMISQCGYRQVDVTQSYRFVVRTYHMRSTPELFQVRNRLFRGPEAVQYLYHSIQNLSHMVTRRVGTRPWNVTLFFYAVNPRRIQEYQAQLRDNIASDEQVVSIRNRGRPYGYGRRNALGIDLTLYRRVPIVDPNNPNAFIPYELFIEKINELRAPSEFQPSDQISVNYILDPSRFAIRHLKQIIAASSLIKKYKMTWCKHWFYVLGDSSPCRSHGPEACFFDCLSIYIRWKLPDPTDKVVKKRMLKDVKRLYGSHYNQHARGVTIEEVDYYLTDLGINAVVYGEPDNGSTERVVHRTTLGSHVVIDDPVELFYNAKNNHVSLILERKDTVLRCDCGQTFTLKRDFTSHVRRCPSASKPRTFDSSNVDSTPLLYDIEAVLDYETGRQHPYAIGWIWENEYHDAVGIECIHTFLHFVFQLRKNVTLIAYNGCRYDLYHLLYTMYNNEEIASKVRIESTTYNNQTFYSLKIQVLTSCCMITTWDPVLFFNTSMENLCKGFGIDTMKEPFSHEEIEYEFNEDNIPLQDRMSRILRIHGLQVRSYLKQDVRMLQQIYDKIIGLEVEGFDFRNHPTIASFSYSMLRCNILSHYRTISEKITLKDLFGTYTKSDYQFIRSALIGGRVQCFKKGHFIAPEGHGFKMLDIVSMYPTVMRSCEIPIGQYQQAHEEIPGKLGIYRCTIHFQTQPNVVAYRSEDGGLDWDYEGSFNVTLSTVTIALVRERYGEDAITVHGGVYWEASTSNLFTNVIDRLFQLKAAQKQLKLDKDPTFNEPLYQAVKVCINSLYGKMCQKIYPDRYDFSDKNTQSKHPNFHSEYFDFDIIGPYLELYTTPVPDKQYTHAKPQHIGVFILDYSKAMLHRVLHKYYNHIYYTDTDSILIDDCIFPEFTLSEELGGWDDETSHVTVKEIIVVQKKMYALIDEQGNLVKARMKGVNMNRDTYTIIEGPNPGDPEPYQRCSFTEVFAGPPDLYADDDPLSLSDPTSGQSIDRDCFLTALQDPEKIQFNCFQLRRYIKENFRLTPAHTTKRIR
jgi:hypothetical protein